MEKKSKLTVFFDAPFWVGVYERVEADKLEAARIVFGSEPKDYEIYEFLNKNWSGLRFSPPVSAEQSPIRKINPKRIRRQINRQLDAQSGVGTKAQQALKLQQEEGKEARKKKNKQQKEEEAQRKFLKRQAKRKEKHNGK